MVFALLLLTSCEGPHASGPEGKLTVAAAANLTEVFAVVARAFKTQSGIDVAFSYGSTAQLAQQIENGAPFDVFAAADTEHVDALASNGKLNKESRAIYALGQLALWVPKGKGSEIHELKDLANKEIRFISVAQPKLAPYGQATVEALNKAGLWDLLEPKMVYTNSISQAKQAAASGNADAAFTAYSLVLRESGTTIKIDRHTYRPIEQALGIVTSSSHVDEAKKFRSFLLSAEGQAILLEGGYLSPQR